MKKKQFKKHTKQLCELNIMIEKTNEIEIDNVLYIAFFNDIIRMQTNHVHRNSIAITSNLIQEKNVFYVKKIIKSKTVIY